LGSTDSTLKIDQVCWKAADLKLGCFALAAPDPPHANAGRDEIIRRDPIIEKGGNRHAASIKRSAVRQPFRCGYGGN